METFELILLSAQILTIIFLILLFNRIPKNQVSKQIEHKLSTIELTLDRLERSIREEFSNNRKELFNSAAQSREELSKSFQMFSQNILSSMSELSNQQKNLLDSFSKQLTDLTLLNEQKLERVKATVEERLTFLQEDNNRKLEQMRLTVDEKLHATLEQRLGESFKLVSERLELVHKGLGEMQTLASGVGDLKRVLTNVKTRGALGEIQLENILEQILTVEQYDKNVVTKKGSNDRVEFAVKLPSRDDRGEQIYLPIDSKFPLEDYQRLQEAEEMGNQALIGEAIKNLEARIKLEAKRIRDKYIDPPNTTDFALMFLPIEGLYAEVLKRPGLWEVLQREYRVVVTGPTTLTALLNSLQMGFRTLAIQKRTSEVWQILGAVKTEFGKFGDILEKTHKKLQEASNTIESASVRTRAIERKLKSVEELPPAEAARILPEFETV
jgi:DNA recombination protein RmuC